MCPRAELTHTQKLFRGHRSRYDFHTPLFGNSDPAPALQHDNQPVSDDPAADRLQVFSVAVHIANIGSLQLVIITGFRGVLPGHAGEADRVGRNQDPAVETGAGGEKKYEKEKE